MTALRVVDGDWDDYVRFTRRRLDLMMPSMVNLRGKYDMSAATWDAFKAECWALAQDVDVLLPSGFKAIAAKYDPGSMIGGAGI